MRRGLVLGLLALLLVWGVPGLAVAQDGREIAYGDVVQATITPQAYRHVYYFSARQGDFVSLSMTVLSGDLDALLVLADNAGQVLARADDAQADLSAAISTVQIPADGYYFVIATRFGNEFGSTTGEFELSLQRVGVAASTGLVLAYGDALIDIISNENYEITYAFQAGRGDIVNIAMRRISGSLDPYLTLANASGQILAANDDSDGSLDAEIRDFLVLETGRYTITASRFGGLSGPSQGSFVLSLDTAPTSGLGLTPDAALFIRYGDDVTGRVDDDNPLHYYTFGAQRGDIVTISLEHASGTLDPLLQLLSPQRQVVAEDDDSGAGRNALLPSYIVPETGNYYILVTRFERQAGQTSGEYTLRLNGVTGDVPVVAPGTLTILYNSTVTGQIENANPAITYAFLARAGDVIMIDMTARDDDLDPLLLLFDTESEQLAEDDDSGPGRDARISNFTIPADGTYYIIATRFEFQGGTTAGAYDLTLTLVDPDAAS